jgi:hypothetical protein
MNYWTWIWRIFWIRSFFEKNYKFEILKICELGLRHGPVTLLFLNFCCLSRCSFPAVLKKWNTFLKKQLYTPSVNVETNTTQYKWHSILIWSLEPYKLFSVSHHSDGGRFSMGHTDWQIDLFPYQWLKRKQTGFGRFDKR